MKVTVRIPQPGMMGASGTGVQIVKKPFSSLLRIRQTNLERYNPDKRRKDRQRTPVVSFRNKTHLFSVVVVLCQFAMVDDLLFLPTGTILYTLGIALVIEIFQDQDVSAAMPWGHDAFANANANTNQTET